LIVFEEWSIGIMIRINPLAWSWLLCKPDK
jgi:hypothetical protein